MSAKYQSCQMIDGFFLNFNGRIDTGEQCLSLCCEASPGGVPGVPMGATGRETIKQFIQKREQIIAESRRLAVANESLPRIHTAGCAQCANFQTNRWTCSKQVQYVNLSMYPAPCQCRCIYCSVHKDYANADHVKVNAAYERMFDALDYAKRSGLIAENAAWQVSTGEITIHPYRERILDLVQNQRVFFYTNCFRFDPQIAENLKANPNSAINLSIDAGLPQTWHKIKGFDNFEEVTSNLVHYYLESARPGQITLKYIVLPGINDTLEDYLSLIDIMKTLKVPHLTISRDTSKKYAFSPKEQETLVGAAAYLFALCHKNEISNDMFAFTPEERSQIVAFAQELIQAGQI